MEVSEDDSTTRLEHYLQLTTSIVTRIIHHGWVVPRVKLTMGLLLLRWRSSGLVNGTRLVKLVHVEGDRGEGSNEWIRFRSVLGMRTVLFEETH